MKLDGYVEMSVCVYVCMSVISDCTCCIKFMNFNTDVISLNRFAIECILAITF